MAVALLALFVAMGGTGYAIATLPAHSVGTKQLKKNAVTGKKIRKNAVTSRKVRNFSLLAKDFKLGQLPAGAKGAKGDQGPPGPTFAAAATVGASDPGASPDESSASATALGRHFGFTLPTGGNVYVRFFIPSWTLSCSAGLAKSGLYLDGAPIPKSAQILPAPDSKITDTAVVTAMGAGAHSLEARSDCPAGNPGASLQSVPTWTVLLVGN
jgi:hypothetical protein